MISDDSSSDSETGRFKGRSTQAESVRTRTKEDFRSSRRDRPTENDRFRREFDRKRDERDHYDKRSRERHRYSRHSPAHKRRHSREKSPKRRSTERPRHGGDYRPKQKDRSKSRERLRRSESKSHKTSEPKQDLKEEIKQSSSRHKSVEKNIDIVKEKSSSPDPKSKKSIIHIPPPTETVKRQIDSPIIVEDHVASDVSEEVQPGSYYSMVPAVVQEISEESSEIDSSDDERLRAKLLNLEKELQKTRKKKHKKKKRKSSKPNKDRDNDTSNSVEVTSTTDIQGKVIDGEEKSQNEVAEVTSTQKQKDSSEEGEISSDDNSQSSTNIDPGDLRHKLKRTKNTDSGSNPDVCGPALPPHLEKRFRSSSSPATEGPSLPPKLKQKDKTVGPSIPDELRKVLAENGEPVLKYESSDEDGGIGPLPAGTEDRWSEAHQRLEERALHMKIKQLDGQTLDSSKIKAREEWMLELPEGKTKYLGLEARTFRAKAGPDMSDRSSWTNTPEEKAKKEAGIVTEDPDQVLQREARDRFIATRDEEQEKAVRRHKKKHKREESLLDMHQKKLKKKKKKEEKDEDKKERRPFSRDVDLQVNRFDEAQKKSIIKKAQGLNTRFSKGEAKYL